MKRNENKIGAGGNGNKPSTVTKQVRSITNLSVGGFLVSDCSTKQQQKLMADTNERDPLVVTFVFLSPRFLRLVSSINTVLCASSNAT